MVYDDFSNHYKLIAIDLSKKIDLETNDLKQKINFTGKLEENDGATMFNFLSIIYNENTKEYKFVEWFNQ